SAAAAELRNARGAVTGAAGALLLIHLLAGPGDLRPVLHGVRARPPLGELPADHAENQIRARLEAKHLVGELDRTGRLTVERRNVDLHGSVLLLFFLRGGGVRQAELAGLRGFRGKRALYR